MHSKIGLIRPKRDARHSATFDVALSEQVHPFIASVCLEVLLCGTLMLPHQNRVGEWTVSFLLISCTASDVSSYRGNGPEPLREHPDLPRGKDQYLDN
jgi:hypothetical protein